MALAVLAAALVHSGFEGEALETAERLVALYPDTAEARGARGWVLLRCGEAVEALREFDLAAQLDPDDMLSVAHRAAALSDLGRDDEAIEAFGRVAASEPSLLSRDPQLKASFELSKERQREKQR
jgi:tetratricopeptide (TPR) repeat protein